MACLPTSPQSLEALAQLQTETQERGDQCLSLLLGGVGLFVRLGRELELLDAMRQMGAELADAVAGTPTATELERLYRDRPSRSDSGPTAS